ncbi:MAG: response regulator [Phycisphaerae bacterium]|nr:response regulator [Phycisphaerae bacterium]
MKGTQNPRGNGTDMTQPPKILVVDDDPEFLDSTKTMLEGNSYRVAVAPGEDEALAEMEADKPDLLGAVQRILGRAAEPAGSTR